MALATQCPYCQTTFRVANDQLKLRTGLVRCGHCRKVFNGIEYLVPPDKTMPVTSLTPPPPTAPKPTPIPMQAAVTAHSGVVTQKPIAPPHHQSKSAQVETTVHHFETDLRRLAELEVKHANSPKNDTGHAPFKLVKTAHNNDLQHDTLAHPHAVQHHTNERHDNQVDRMTLIHIADGHNVASETLPVSHNRSKSPHDDDLDRIIDELQNKPWSKSKPSSSKATVNTTTRSSIKNPRKIEQPIPLDEPEFVLAARHRQRMDGILRTSILVGSGILLIALLGQSIYLFRTQLAVRLPQTKPFLMRICATFGCHVGLPMKIDSISLESNELQVVNTARNTFVLSLLLRNRSDTVQAWPNIELILNDSNSKPIVRRVFTPSDYLSANVDITQGFPSDLEQSVKLTFELTQLKASGYLVGLFYP